MTHENAHGGQPRHRAEYQPDQTDEPKQDRAGDAYVRNIVEHAPTPEAAASIAYAYESHSTAFAIYLALEGVDKYVRDHGNGPHSDATHLIEADFKDLYHGFFPDREALVEDTIRAFNWRTQLDLLLGHNNALRRVLTFNQAAIYDFAAEYYEVVEIDRGLYVFERLR